MEIEVLILFHSPVNVLSIVQLYFLLRQSGHSGVHYFKVLNHRTGTLLPENVKMGLFASLGTDENEKLGRIFIFTKKRYLADENRI